MGDEQRVWRVVWRATRPFLACIPPKLDASSDDSEWWWRWWSGRAGEQAGGPEAADEDCTVGCKWRATRRQRGGEEVGRGRQWTGWDRVAAFELEGTFMRHDDKCVRAVSVDYSPHGLIVFVG
jgi:hypothetical protein